MTVTRLNPPIVYKDVQVTGFTVGEGVSFYQGTTPQTPAGYTRIAALVVAYQRPGTSIVAVTAMDDSAYFVTAYSSIYQGALRFTVRFVYAVAQAG